MRIESKPYGTIEIDEQQLVTFPRGLLGFESHLTWALLDSAQPPFFWLQSIDEPGLAFVLLAPTFFRPDYLLELSETDREALGQPTEAEILSFAIVTIPEDQNRMTANLQGPLVINKRARIGRQTIQASPQWRVRHLILDELAAIGAP